MPRLLAPPPADLAPRRAALVAAVAYLLNPVPYAETVVARLLVPGNIEQTAQNAATHPGHLNAAILCYLAQLIGDIVLAWALFYLVAPVSRPLALLTAWFQLAYAAVALSATFNLLAVPRLLHTPAYLAAFGAAPLHAQVDLLMHSFRYDWSFSLILFGVHLGLLGYLVIRSGYIPWLVGAALMVAGGGYVADGASPYLVPGITLVWLPVTFFGELVFVLWLLIRGWKIPQLPPAPASSAPLTQV